VEVVIQVGLEMVIVMMRQTMQAAILMVGTVVETTLTLNIVMNVFVINKLECLKHCCLPVSVDLRVKLSGLHLMEIPLGGANTVDS
jgi:hypothetical protein